MSVPTFTEEQLAALEQGMIDRKGAIFATFGDQQISFASYGDLQNWIGERRRELAQAAAAAAGGSTTRYAATSKGV